MAFGELNIAKKIMSNAPKYDVIIEPFGDNGSVSFYSKKKKPKKHIVNYENVEMFNLMLFIQKLSSSDKKSLKSKNWIGSEDVFNSVVSIKAQDGPDFFHKYFYLKNFQERTLDIESPAVFDFLMAGMDIKNLLYKLPLQKLALKKVTLLNEVSANLISSGSGNSFTILVPKGQDQVDAVESKLKSLSGNYFYAKKVMNNQSLIDTVKNNLDKNVTTWPQASIMMATMQGITNYDSKLIPIVLDTKMKM